MGPLHPQFAEISIVPLDYSLPIAIRQMNEFANWIGSSKFRESLVVLFALIEKIKHLLIAIESDRDLV